MSKNFSAYNSNNPLSEKDAALEFARKRNQIHLENLRKSEDFQEKEALKKEEQEKIKEAEMQELKRVLAIPDKVIQENLKKAEENNKKFSASFDQNSSIDDLISSILE